MNKPTLAFIDHSFHKKTGSSAFLHELFRESFEVSEYWDESWAGGPAISAETINGHDYVFYMQVMSSISELAKVKIPIIWAPMYDGTKFNYPYWKIIASHNVKILSFSKKISAWCSRFLIPTLSVQYYYIKPGAIPNVQGNHVLFWYRGGITFDNIRKIISAKQVDSFTLIVSPDVKKDMLKLSESDMFEYKILRIDGFLSRKEYIELLEKSSIFIAPRKKEGIGAFTEALALGKCVIAYDDATHNEYITHGVDGLLFTEKSQLLDLSQTHALGVAAQKRATEKQHQWNIDRDKIAQFVYNQYPTNPAIIPTTFWKLLNFLWVFIIKMRARIKKLFRLLI